jgi:hypothetical protein
LAGCLPRALTKAEGRVGASVIQHSFVSVQQQFFLPPFVSRASRYRLHGARHGDECKNIPFIAGQSLELARCASMESHSWSYFSISRPRAVVRDRGGLGTCFSISLNDLVK